MEKLKLSLTVHRQKMYDHNLVSELSIISLKDHKDPLTQLRLTRTKQLTRRQAPAVVRHLSLYKYKYSKFSKYKYYNSYLKNNEILENNTERLQTLKTKISNE